MKTVKPIGRKHTFPQHGPQGPKSSPVPPQPAMKGKRHPAVEALHATTQNPPMPKPNTTDPTLGLRNALKAQQIASLAGKLAGE